MYIYIYVNIDIYRCINMYHHNDVYIYIYIWIQHQTAPISINKCFLFWSHGLELGGQIISQHLPMLSIILDPFHFPQLWPFISYNFSVVISMGLHIL